MKRISAGTVTVGVFAIILGLVATYVVKQSLSGGPIIQPQPPQGKSIVVARVNLSKHTRLRTGDLEVITVPATAKIPEGTIRKPAIAAGRVIKTPVKAGQALHEQMLFGIGERGPGIADQIPAGYRGVTIKVDDSHINRTMIKSDSRVDIAMSVEGKHPDLGELATRTLLRSVPVVDVSSRQGSEFALTVAVTPKDANKLINAQRSGALSVTLCSAQETEPPLGGNDNVTRRELLGLREIPQPPEPYRVEKWEGSTMKMIELSESHVQEAQRAAVAGKAGEVIRPSGFQNVSNPAEPPTSTVNPKIVAPRIFVRSNVGNDQ